MAKIIKMKDLLTEKKVDTIRVQGIGVYTYKTLKKDVEKKLKDLTRRNKQGAHYGVGKNQFNVLSAMWLALKEYEEKRKQNYGDL